VVEEEDAEDAGSMLTEDLSFCHEEDLQKEELSPQTIVQAV